MDVRPLGRTGLEVSVIGFGCGDTGGLMVRGRPDEQVRAVSAALEAGINFFDTSDSYGDGRSEIALGRALRELGATPVVATKVTRSDVELADGQTIRRSLEESLKRLGREQVDLFILHGRVGTAEGLGGGMDIERILGPIAEGMVAVREAGLTRFIGFNGLGNTQDIHRVADLGIWDAAHCYINALNPSAGWPVRNLDQQDFQNLIGTCADRGIGPIAIRVFAAGALAPDITPHPNARTGGRAMVQGGEREHELERARKLESIVRQAGAESAMELSLRFVLAHPSIGSVLVGTANVEQLEDSLRWAARGPLPANEVQSILALYQ